MIETFSCYELRSRVKVCGESCRHHDMTHGAHPEKTRHETRAIAHFVALAGRPGLYGCSWQFRHVYKLLQNKSGLKLNLLEIDAHPYFSDMREDLDIL